MKTYISKLKDCYIRCFQVKKFYPYINSNNVFIYYNKKSFKDLSYLPSVFLILYYKQSFVKEKPDRIYSNWKRQINTIKNYKIGRYNISLKVDDVDNTIKVSIRHTDDNSYVYIPEKDYEHIARQIELLLSKILLDTVQF